MLRCREGICFALDIHSFSEAFLLYLVSLGCGIGMMVNISQLSPNTFNTLFYVNSTYYVSNQSHEEGILRHYKLICLLSC